MDTYRIPVWVTRDIEGWEAYCPEFPDCRARGMTYENAVENLEAIVQVLVEDGLGDDESLLKSREMRFLDVRLPL